MPAPTSGPLPPARHAQLGSDLVTATDIDIALAMQAYASARPLPSPTHTPHPLPGPHLTQTAHTHPPHACPAQAHRARQVLAEGVRVLSVVATVQETTKVYGRAGVQENTRIVTTARHKIPRALPRLAVGLVDAHTAPGHRSSSSGSMPGYFAHHQTPSTHPSASIPEEIYHNHVESHFDPNAPAVQELNGHDVVTHLSISILPSAMPTHALEPLHVSHRLRSGSILIANRNGHPSELRCSLPLHLLDRRLLTEAQTATFQTRRLLLGGPDLSEAQRDEQELPSYRSHVYDHVANQYMPDAATRRITNPWVHTGTNPVNFPSAAPRTHAPPPHASPAGRARPRARKVRQCAHIAKHVPRAVAREYGAPHAEQRHLPVQRCVADRLRTTSSAGARCSAESAAAGKTGVLHGRVGRGEGGRSDVLGEEGGVPEECVGWQRFEGDVRVEDGLDPHTHRGAHKRKTCGGRGGDTCGLEEDGAHELDGGAAKGDRRVRRLWLWSGQCGLQGRTSADDETLINALNKYHKERLSSNKKIAARLAAEHQIHMSESSVKRRRKELGLLGSGPTTRALPHAVKEQMVVDQLNRDPAKRHGVRTIMQKVAFNEHTHLTKKFVSDIMHLHDNDAFATREPTAKRIHRFPKYPIGIHERWSGDGHDKLYKIGFPIWAMVDDATGKWLGAWVVPSNRMGEIVAYLFLCLVEKFEGLPLQASTDCGSETTKLFALMNALRSWLRLRLDWGDNVVLFFNKGIDDGIYNPNNARQYELCQWLWPKLLRTDLAEFMEFRNAAPMRKDKQKPGPSGMSRNEAFSIPSNWGGRNCLLPVDVKVIQEIKAAMGGDALLDFVTPEYATRCEEAYNSLGMSRLTLENIWHVFTALYPLIYQ
ncbi:hypothetical protein HWV62_20752 [Athelia sp. TMB]|nr:hypothetical protein HWV62_20752 [Athelia sp. TMB]